MVDMVKEAQDIVQDYAVQLFDYHKDNIELTIIIEDIRKTDNIKKRKDWWKFWKR